MGYEEGESLGLSMRSPRESQGSLSARNSQKDKPSLSGASTSNDEDAKELPPEEFKDFLSSYD